MRLSKSKIFALVLSVCLILSTFTTICTAEENTVNAVSAVSFPDNPGWGNFMVVNFDNAICVPANGAELITNVEKMDSTNPLYNQDAVNSVLNKILVNHKTISEWIASGVADAAQIHMAATDIRIYLDSSLFLFNDGNATVEIAEGFKTLTGKQTSSSATFYYSSQTKQWSTTAPMSAIEIDKGQSYPDHPDWGNFMEVLFKEDICPSNILTDGLITNVQAMNDQSANYNGEVVNSVLNKLTIDGKTVAAWLAENPEAVQIHMSNNGIRVYMKAELVAFADGNTHTVEVLSGFTTFINKIVENSIALHFDPTNNSWGSNVVTPPKPAAGNPANVFSVTDLLVTDSGFANVYFYMTDIINRIPTGTINVQAGGNNIPEDVQNSVLDKIIIDGKSVREWNAENESNYSVMIAYETETTPQGTFGRLSIWSNVNESSLSFTQDKDHTIEFLDGLLGLNYAPITPSKWKYSGSDMIWEQVEAGSTDSNPEDSNSSNETENKNNPENNNAASPSADEKNPHTSDTSVGYIFVLSAVSLAAILLSAKKYRRQVIE